MSLKKAYLYLVSVISLVIWVVGAIMLMNLALKTWVFPAADKNVYYTSPCASNYDAQGKLMPCSNEQEDMYKKQDEENRRAQKQRDAATALSMIIIAAPVWWFHWRLARKEV